DIGIIVMDEEHETTYKSDMTPKYETSEVAIKRLREHQGVFLMGSATPSVVSWYRACGGIYEKLELTERYNKVMLPQVETVDMREELKSGNTGIFSGKLEKGIRETLARGQQVILFLNRRGYSSFVSCRECGEAVRCPDCGISMTYHKGEDRLICHYCGRSRRVPDVCPSCGSRYIKYFGSGTEQVEEAAKKQFAGHRIARLDFDTARRKGSIEKIIDSFSKGETDILVGTQLVAKGLDFRNVGLVGIMSADTTLNIPDFRSPERTFQLITQAAGRAGRGDEKGRVIIQTYSPDNYAVKAAAAQNYDAFYEDEIALRQFMNYPPCSDLIQVMFTSKSPETARYWGGRWTERLRKLLPEEPQNVFDLQEAPMAKIKDSSRYFFLVKCPKGKRALYMGALDHLKKTLVPDSRPACRIGIDINPYSFM
ncbi:MAG: primosomal protein N', partial [Firmicutes bacterium]|nr:primosomal protein N' [Bacillota bacterium]